MSKVIKSVRGFNDVLPENSYVWNQVLGELKQVLAQYNAHEILLPYLESTNLFARGVGEATDIVEKEMFTFKSRDEESLTLRPEGTAGAMRAAIEHGLTYNQEQRLYYFGPMFRYERPQKGRYRQFYQLGVEFLGVKSPACDVEVLQMNHDFWKALGLTEALTLEINTIGSSAERAEFAKALVAYLTEYKDQLDEDSKRRLTTNPLRILDSKDAKTQEILLNAPKLMDFLSEESKAYYAEVKALLTAQGINFVENPKLVRGLDYYNDTVYEWTTDKLGAQGTVCGGGRYDKLVETLGGKPCPGFGFGMGYERLLLLIQEVHGNLGKPSTEVFMICEGETKETAMSMTLANQLRQAGVSVINNFGGGKLKKQFTKADKAQAQVVVIVNDQALEANLFPVKNLKTGDQVEVAQDAVVKTVADFLRANKEDGLSEVKSIKQFISKAN